MKTKDRILLASLDAFSTEGVGQISTNHIADIMDISPGNLYYHFQSKGEIIVALYNCFKTDFSVFVKSIEGHIKTPEEVWLVLNLTFQLMSKYRFIFRDASYSSSRYPELKKPFKTLLKATRSAIDDFCHYLQKQQLLKLSTQQSFFLATSIHVTLTQWFDYADIYLPEQKKTRSTPDQEQHSKRLISLGVSQTISLMSPYMIADEQLSFEQMLEPAHLQA